MSRLPRGFVETGEAMSKVSTLEWEEVWTKLLKQGWELQKHGELKRAHYLLPNGQKDKPSCRNGSYITKLTAKDGSGRCCYRTRAEVLYPSCPPARLGHSHPSFLPVCPPSRHIPPSLFVCQSLVGFLRS